MLFCKTAPPRRNPVCMQDRIRMQTMVGSLADLALIVIEQHPASLSTYSGSSPSAVNNFISEAHYGIQTTTISRNATSPTVTGLHKTAGIAANTLMGCMLCGAVIVVPQLSRLFLPGTRHALYLRVGHSARRAPSDYQFMRANFSMISTH